MQVYTDGGARPSNPGPGGWGVVAYDEGTITTLSGGEKHTTNNRMELTAVTKAIETFGDKKLEIITDSQYVQKGITEWIKTWKRNGWRTSARKAVKNQDMWMTLDELVSTRDVTFTWTRGHSGQQYNELADQLATEAAIKAGSTSS